MKKQLTASNDLWSSIIAKILIVFNLLLFCYLVSRSILWVNGESLALGYLWSIDTFENANLHTTIHLKDFLKIFNSQYIDGFFRIRHFSSLVDMLIFKAEQGLGIAFFKNYGYILLHIINSALAARIIFFLTRNKNTSILAGLISLNSGIALATLMYPFRIPKLLVTTLFFLIWIILIKDNQKIKDFPIMRLISLGTLITLMLFTDEIAVFFIVTIIGLSIYQNGLKNLIHPKIILTLLITSFLNIGLYNLTLWFNVILAGEAIIANAHGYLLKQMAIYFTTPQTYSDLANSFVFFFLRRNFGYWNSNLAGILALIAALLIFYLTLKSLKNSKHNYIALILFSFILIKAFLLPHISGYHPHFMPEGTVFPSLLFFSYYYTYPDGLLACLIIILLISNYTQKPSNFLFCLILISTISFSNVYNLKDGPHDTRLHFETHTKEALTRNKRVLLLREKLSNPDLTPLYVSHVTGKPKALKLKRNAKENSSKLGTSIALRYFKSVKEGTLILPYSNTRPNNEPISDNPSLNEITAFYDIHRDQITRLEPLKKHPSWNNQKTISQFPHTEEVILSKKAKNNHIVFFVKGLSNLRIYNNSKQIATGAQTYGHSYEMFEFQINTANMKLGKITLRIDASDEKEVHLIGPMLIDSPKGL